MQDSLTFATRSDFRAWLLQNGATSAGVWLLFGKKGGPKTLKAAEALEEALCFGWIDGQMQSVDETRYIKYFAKRRPQSVWSQKNKDLVGVLIEKGLMTDAGIEAVKAAKQSGAWAAAGARVQPSDEEVEVLAALLKGHEPAYQNFLKMSSSVKKTYTGHYLDAKSEETKKRRLMKIIDRLDQNLKPM